MTHNFLIEAQNEVIPNIGQIDPASKRTLERAVKNGLIDKWRGKWFPVAGAPFGIGPDKTCYGPVGSKIRWSGWE